MKTTSKILVIWPIILLLILSVSSCSWPGKKKQESSEMVVSVEDGLQSTTPDLADSAAGFGTMGPAPDKNYNQNVASGEKTPVVAVILGPGLNRTAAYVSFFKIMQKNRVPIHIVSGVEMGAILAAWYAKNQAPAKMEWIFYNFLKESKALRPYSGRWLKVVEEIFLLPFKGEQIEGQKISLIIPLYDKKERKIKYMNRGDLYQALSSNLNINNTGDSYGSAIQSEIFNRESLLKFGADIVVGLDVLGKNPDFKEQTDFLTGIYGKAAWQMEQDKDKVDMLINLPIDNMAMDTQNDLSLNLQTCEKASEMASQQILQKIKEWQMKGNVSAGMAQ
ncbi:MAG: hypothetical protein WCG27_09260 [Pseudomonadota bacterium]